MFKLLTLEDTYRPVPGHRDAPARVQHAHRFAGGRPIPCERNADLPPLVPVVNHGRWIIECPCGNADVAPDDGWFLCVSCWNAGVGGEWRPVRFPFLRTGIEAALIVRPAGNRNWRPPETVDQLVVENDAHPEVLLR